MTSSGVLMRSFLLRQFLPRRHTRRFGTKTPFLTSLSSGQDQGARTTCLRTLSVGCAKNAFKDRSPFTPSTRNYSNAPSQPQIRITNTGVLIIVIASTTLGLLLAKLPLFSPENILGGLSGKSTSQDASSVRPQFATSEEMKRAILELEESFGGAEKVSTDPDDLHNHGFSANDHHPGEYF